LLYAAIVAKTSKANTLKAVRLPDEYIQGLERIATRNFESVSDVLRRAVRELIAREEKIST
jgi:Arc/MetJ-type ribon-helix-helix transcriptional regulator